MSILGFDEFPSVVEIDSVSDGLILSDIECISDNVRLRFNDFNLRIDFKSSINPGYIVR